MSSRNLKTEPENRQRYGEKYDRAHNRNEFYRRELIDLSELP